MKPNRILDVLRDRFHEVLIRVIEIQVVEDLPIPAYPKLAIAHLKQVARQQFNDILKQCLARKAELEGQVILETLQVRFDTIEKRQECLDFRTESNSR